jgi:hypothetical protein
VETKKTVRLGKVGLSLFLSGFLKAEFREVVDGLQGASERAGQQREKGINLPLVHLR